MKSWRKTLTVLLSALLLILLLFLFWTNINYYLQIKDSIKEENTHTVEIWKSSTETRLNALYEHLHELLLEIYNHTELGAGTPIMKYTAQQECLDMIADKLLINEDAYCFYIQDSDRSLQLFSASNRIKDSEKYALKNYFYNTDFDNPIGLGNTEWSIESIGGKVYFIKTISLGKYTVGLASGLSEYDISKNFSIFGSEVSCLMISNRKIYRVCGEDWSGEVHFTELGTVSIADKSIIAVQTTFDKCNAQVVLATRQNILSHGNFGSMLLIIASMLCFALLLLLLILMQRMIVRPTQEILLANHELCGGNAEYRITKNAHSKEFGELFNSFNEMADNLHKMRIASYNRQLQEQEGELKMLRAQLRPHFYLNAITTVSNMTYQNRNEDIRAYLAALAKYMRYMLNYQSKWVTVKEEVCNIKSYLEMQQIKFPGSVDVYVGCSEDIEETKVPYLLLFTAVENSFKYAMNLYETLRLLVQCEYIQTEGFRGCRMIVEDNGKGFSEDVLAAFSWQGSNAVPSAKDHFGLTNISRTLQLIYHRNDLLRLSNAATGGAHVEILIPEGNYEAFDL